MDEPEWLPLARELQAIAQAGLAFTRDPYDQQRFQRLRELAAHLLARGSDLPVEKILGLFAQERGYPTPKIDVRTAAFRDGRILMVREASDGGWTLPGGWADVNQSAAECAAREVTEESGFEVRILKLAALLDFRRQGHVARQPASIYKAFFIGELTGGTARPSVETTAVAFFAPDALPALSAGRITARQIHRMFAHVAEPSLPTDFD
jgi:ADP-ribose pyrophosphatase YjhB (NUDIX family)